MFQSNSHYVKKAMGVEGRRGEKISSSELVEFDLIAVTCDTKKKERERELLSA
jgi:ribosome-associated protein YbcJ (S4-like RNA binding protein)